jgi:hypothetical protein
VGFFSRRGFFPHSFSFLISSNDELFINSKVFIIINATRSHFFMPFYAYQSFLCLSELFMSVYACQPTNKTGAFYAYQLENAFL